MLVRMIAQGLIAAALIGVGAAVYAQAADGARAPEGGAVAPATQPDTGYLRPTQRRDGERDDEWEARRRRPDERHHDRRRHSRDHDDD